MNTITLEKIAAFVRSHGFDALVCNGFVTIRIPQVDRDKQVSYLFENVRTLKEARDALGY